ncbi:hypothetical protein EVAR_4335_1 [Eumeta japonica]|uniref:Uncharacterized protein n=1 Tax=Eumeta variegata TaxID=151549 RepID=A0A4C1VBE6_EUMVA|nr:hypothetical protein EVAR_4335_1 [Eumeta japonica]
MTTAVYLSLSTVTKTSMKKLYVTEDRSAGVTVPIPLKIADTPALAQPRSGMAVNENRFVKCKFENDVDGTE